MYEVGTGIMSTFNNALSYKAHRKFSKLASRAKGSGDAAGKLSDSLL